MQISLRDEKVVDEIPPPLPTMVREPGLACMHTLLRQAFSFVSSQQKLPSLTMTSPGTMPS